VGIYSGNNGFCFSGGQHYKSERKLHADAVRKDGTGCDRNIYGEQQGEG
jgi:hypothetical protein